jgi:hypothetical protein
VIDRSDEHVHKEIDSLFLEPSLYNYVWVMLTQRRDELQQMCHDRYDDAQEHYKGVWREWSAERHEEEAMQELADFVNYKVFKRLQQAVNDH